MKHLIFSVMSNSFVKPSFSIIILTHIKFLKLNLVVRVIIINRDNHLMGIENAVLLSMSFEDLYTTVLFIELYPNIIHS